MIELSEKWGFGFVKTCKVLSFLRFWVAFRYVPFPPSALILRETGQHGAGIAISFCVSFLKLATTKLVSALWFTLIGLLCFCYTSPSWKSKKKRNSEAVPVQLGTFLLSKKQAGKTLRYREVSVLKLSVRLYGWGGIYLQKKWVDFHAFTRSDA